MSGPVSFTTNEFIRLQTQVTNLMQMKNELEAELAIWKPIISINASKDPANPGIVYTVQYGNDGFQMKFAANVLASMQPEVLDDAVFSLARDTALNRTKKIDELIRPVMAKAADYCKIAVGGK